MLPVLTVGVRSDATISNSRGPKPSGGRSIASDRATNASGGVLAEAADGLRGVVAALAEWHMGGVPVGRHRAKAILRRLQTRTTRRELAKP